MSRCTLLLNELSCAKDTGEPGHDEIYFKIWVDGDYWGTHPSNADEGVCFRMNDSDDNLRKCKLDLSLHYGDSVKIELREQDKKNNASKDEVIDDFTIYTSTVKLGDTNYHSNTVSGSKATYTVSWRLMSQKVPSLRLLGIKCQKSSAGCNQELADSISTIVNDCLAATEAICGELKSPKAEVIGEMCGVAQEIVTAVTALAKWLADVCEGDDDCYLQTTFEGQQASDAVAFCPPNGGVIKLNDGDNCFFMETYGCYFRFPLDKEKVTIEIREKDQAAHDTSLGAFTVGKSDYDANIQKGAFARPLDTFLDKSKGQGAIYHVVYSYAFEDWSLAANQE